MLVYWTKISIDIVKSTPYLLYGPAKIHAIIYKARSSEDARSEGGWEAATSFSAPASDKRLSAARCGNWVRALVSMRGWLIGAPRRKEGEGVIQQKIHSARRPEREGEGGRERGRGIGGE